MPYSTLNWAWEVRGLTSPQKFLLVALADMADENHSCFPGQATLAEMTSSGRRAVVSNLARLEELGYFSRERRSRENGSRTSDRFVLHVGHQHRAGLGAPDDLSADSARASDAGLGASDDATYVHEVHGQKNPQRNTQVEPPEVGAQKRAARLPEPFIVTRAMREWAASETPAVDVDAATRMFVDHFRGNGKPMKDWVATWRNWLRRDQQRVGGQGPRRGTVDTARSAFELLQQRDAQQKAIAS